MLYISAESIVNVTHLHLDLDVAAGEQKRKDYSVTISRYFHVNPGRSRADIRNKRAHAFCLALLLPSKEQ
jgi:hypothetical protein